MRLSIGKRLLVGFLLLFCLELAIVGAGIFNLSRLSNLNQRTIRLIVPMEEVYELLLDFEEIVIPINNYVVHGNPVEKEVFKIKSEDLEKRLIKIKLLFPIGGGPEFIQIADTQFQHIKEVSDKVFAIERPVGTMEAAMLMEEIDAFTDKAVESIDAYHEEYLDKQLDYLKVAGSRIVKNAVFLFLSFSFLGMLLSFFLAYFLARRIQRPIAYLEAACKRLAKGYWNGKVEIKTQDEMEELARTFNQMVSSLKEAEEEKEKSQTEKIKMIEELRAARAELEGYSRTLENRVAERTRELTVSIKEADERRRAIVNMLEDINEAHRGLRQANKELKEAQAKLVQSAKMSAVGQLAGGVAHEINNPLTGVLNNVQLIKMELTQNKGILPSDFNELLDVVEESAQRCNRIVRTLLDFSRAGKGPHQPLNINEALDKALIIADTEMRIGNIKLLKEYSPSLPEIMGDSNQLQQVFLDIFNNAKWALRDTKVPELRIKTSVSSDAKFVVVEISDNGCGIEKENLPHIFEPFFTTKKPGEGTGLGLSICYGIIKEHVGTIEAESEGKDKGATFRINLPVA